MKNRDLIKKAVGKPAKGQFEKLLNTLKNELEPKTFLENYIVSKMAFDFVRLYKVMEFETKEILAGHGIENYLEYKTISGFISYKNSIEKSINASYDMLKRFKKDNSGPKIY